MSIALWLSVIVVATLVGVVLYYRTTEGGRKSQARMEPLVMIAMGLLNILAVGELAAEPSRRWTQLFLAMSGVLAFLYGLYLFTRRQSGRAPDSNGSK